MSHFPKLVPAFTIQIVLQAPQSIGAVAASGPLTLATFVQGEGSLKSEPTYPIQVNAHFIMGHDFLRLDSAGKNMRLNVDSTLKDQSGGLIRCSYTGVMNLSPATGAVLTGHPDAKTTDYGDAVTAVTFETGSDQLKAINDKVYIGTGHFVLEQGKPPVVEYKVSEVVAA